MEGIPGGAAVRGRVGQGTHGLEELDDRAGPAMRHDQRQRVLMPGPDVDEVDLHAIDLGLELRQRVQSRLAPAPVVLGGPVAGELSQRRQLHSLRPILDELLAGPARGRDPSPQFGEFRLGYVHAKRSDIGRQLPLGSCVRGHGALLSSCFGEADRRSGGSSPDDSWVVVLFAKRGRVAAEQSGYRPGVPFGRSPRNAARSRAANGSGGPTWRKGGPGPRRLK